MPRRHDFHRDEGGAIAVIYTAALLAMLGMLALVIDMGALRADKRATRTTADIAATAGAFKLVKEAGGSPQQACVEALDYFLLNASPSSPPDKSKCLSEFPSDASSCDPTVPKTVQFAADPYVVYITWPVIFTAAESAGYSAERDGDPCERLAVEVRRTRGFVFGSVLGTTVGGTGSRSVARAIVGETGREVAALLILDKVGCVGLEAVGNTIVRITGYYDDEEEEWNTGKTYIDSDGSKCSGQQTTITSGGGGTIRAEGDDSDPPEEGEIKLFALPPGANECAVPACSDAEIAASYDLANKGIWPQPVHLPQRTSRDAVDHRFNCIKNAGGYDFLDGTAPGGLDWDVAPCTGNADDYINQLRDAIGQPSSTASDAPSGWTAVEICSTSADQIFDPGVNYFVYCASGQNKITISHDVVFPGGNVVFAGEVILNNNDSKLRVNTANPSTSLGATCVTSVCIDASSSRHAFVYMANGDLSQSGGRLELNHTMLYMYDGAMKITGGEFDWKAPTALSEDGDTGPFEKLALWSDRKPKQKDKPDENSLLGGGSSKLQGVYFTPNSLTKVSGGGGSTPEKAQFFTWRLAVSGGGTVLLGPDKKSAIPVKSFEGVYLIR